MGSLIMWVGKSCIWLPTLEVNVTLDKQRPSTCKTGMESAGDGPHMSDNNQAPVLQNSVIKLDVDVYLREVSEILL